MRKRGTSRRLFVRLRRLGHLKWSELGSYVWKKVVLAMRNAFVMTTFASVTMQYLVTHFQLFYTGM